MAADPQISFDVQLAGEVLARLDRLPVTPGLWRHIEAMARDGAMFEVHRALPGTGCTHRIVPSIQVLRLLEQHEARV